MATKILIKKSSTGGSTPVAGDLDQGELAVNLADRKIYTKDNGNAIVTLDGAYVDSTAPGNPAEGDLWYDTTNNLLKAHNGSAFVSAGYQTLGALEDTTITSIAGGEILKYSGSAWINNTLAEAGIAAASHTHTASNITDFDTEVANNSAVTTNSAKVTNVTTNLGYTTAAGNGTVTSSDGTNATLPAATTSLAGLLTGAKKVAYDALVSNVTTNLGYTTASSTGTVTSSDGTNATLPAATTSLAGLMTAADKTALNAALSSETDTLATVTGRGATTAVALSITNATSSTTTGTGALKVTGGVGIVENLNVGGNTIVTGNLTVNGTTTTVNSNTVAIGDSIITLNSDEAGTPSQNGGFEIERGTSANKSFVWNEADDAWDLAGETLQNVTLDGGTY